MNERQAEALQRAAEALRCAAASAAAGLPMDFWALDLRGALLALGEVRMPGCVLLSDASARLLGAGPARRAAGSGRGAHCVKKQSLPAARRVLAGARDHAMLLSR